jgi:hypothetical protein
MCQNHKNYHEYDDEGDEDKNGDSDEDGRDDYDTDHGSAIHGCFDSFFIWHDSIP